MNIELLIAIGIMAIVVLFCAFVAEICTRNEERMIKEDYEKNTFEGTYFGKKTRWSIENKSFYDSCTKYNKNNSNLSQKKKKDDDNDYIPFIPIDCTPML